MSRLFYHVMQDNAGNLLFDVSGTMRIAGSGTIATIYGDEALTVILPNPMTNHASYGSFKCFLGAGDYDFYMAKSGYNFETLTGVQGHGTMAQQDADAVGIAGGTINNLTSLSTAELSATHAAFVRLDTGIPTASARLALAVERATYDGIVLRPNSDTGGARVPVRFLNAAGGQVGYIDTTDTTTTYATTSDARLKHAIAPLTGALELVRALTPVSFLWNADGSPGRGLVAQEVAAVVPGVVSGDEASGAVLGIDYSKLVPYLIGAVKELTQQVEMLQAQLAAASV